MEKRINLFLRLAMARYCLAVHLRKAHYMTLANVYERGGARAERKAYAIRGIVAVHEFSGVAGHG